MKLKTTLSLLLGLMLIGCSGSQQDQEQLEAEEQEEQYTQEEEQSEEQLADDEEEFEDLVDATPVEPVETVATPAPVSNVEPNRVLRYVGETGAPAYSQATEGQSLGVFPQGTKLMVVEEGEWSRIRDDMYVRTDSLSKKPVPRAKKKAVWSHPAH